MTNQPLDEERIFGVARRLPDAESQSEYLEQICAGDRALRDRVEALLKADAEERSFLKSAVPLSPTSDERETLATVGQQIGRYKLLQKVGEGGFGVVFMAEQTRPVRRKVALKVIKPGMDSQAVVARFEAERQALAMMDHPNIARVFDGGATESGRPYFVMELVKGVPITEYCDKNELSTEQRLHLFTTVCQAVQHAHQKGIIHRDLKPSNVLVTLADGEPIVKVIDFGVAKATNQQLTEKTLFTAFGQMVGTPQYMSPEQAEMSCLDVDTRSDVYSLGVLLYELLTGTTPLQAERLRTAGYAEIQRLIREEEPPKPSTRLSTSGERLTIIAKHRKVTPEKLKNQVRGDLDWIVMKALEKDRNRRYESPNAFSNDLVNCLANQPIQARPPTFGYKAQKYVKRNRWPIAATGIMTLLLLAGLAGTMSQQHKAELALNRLRQAVVEHAKEAIFNADFETAKRLLQDVKDEDISSTQTLNGIIAFYEGRYSDATDALTQATKQDRNDVAAVSMLSVVQHLDGDWMEAASNRRIAFEMPIREEHFALDRLCRAQALILDNRAEETAQTLESLHQDDKKPLVSVVLAHALAHCAFEWDPSPETGEEISKRLADAKNMVHSTENVTRGFHFLRLIQLFVCVLEMHHRNQIQDSTWRECDDRAEQLANRLLKGPPCPTAYMMVAEYYRLKNSMDDVEAVYSRLYDHGWDRFKLACLRESRGDAVDWATLAASDQEDDRLAAVALSKNLLPIPDFTKAGTETSPLTAIAVLLARQDFPGAQGLARSIRKELNSSPESEPSKEFTRRCLDNLQGDLSDDDFLSGSGWPLQVQYRLGLKYYALMDYEKAKRYFDHVIESLHPQVYFNERAHWAMVLRSRIEANETPETGR